MKNERILVLKDIDGYYYFPEQIEGCTFKIIYKNHTYISRVFRKLLLKAKSPMINFFLVIGLKMLIKQTR